MYRRSDIRAGMKVRGASGERLGKVYAVGEGEFHIERGWLFRRDYSCSYEEIQELREGQLVLAHGQDSLRLTSEEMPYEDILPQGFQSTVAVGRSRIIPGTEVHAQRRGSETPDLLGRGEPPQEPQRR